MATSKIRFMYLRDEKDSPIGCLAIKVHRKKGRLEYQLAVLNPIDRYHPLTGKQMPFNREVARHLAAGRLMDQPFTASMPSDADMNYISVRVMEDVAFGNRPVPARAVKAAKLWLRSNSR